MLSNVRVLGLNSRVHTKYFAVFSAGTQCPGTYYPRAFSTDRVHTGIHFLREDYANEPLTSLRLLLLWVYWQASNNFTAYTATRSPRPEVPGVGEGFSRSCWDSQNGDKSSREEVLFLV